MASTQRASRRRIRAFAPDCVGVSSIFSNQADAVHNILAIAKRAAPKATTAIGGAHARYFPAACLKDENLDVVFLGEAELSFLQYLEHLNGGIRGGRNRRPRLPPRWLGRHQLTDRTHQCEGRKTQERVGRVGPDPVPRVAPVQYGEILLDRGVPVTLHARPACRADLHEPRVQRPMYVLHDNELLGEPIAAAEPRQRLRGDQR